MQTQLFLIPQEFDSQGRFVPEYLATDLLNKSWVAMPFGIEGLVLLAADPNPALSAESDVFTFPANLDAVLSADDVSNLQAFFSSSNIPSAYVVAGSTWRDVARTTAKCFQVAQRNNGLTDSAIFSANTGASLVAQSAAVKSGKIVASPAKQLGVQPALSDSLAAFPDVQTNLTAVAFSFGFNTPDPNASVEDALVALGSQWPSSSPIVMDRGDGFRL